MANRETKKEAGTRILTSTEAKDSKQKASVVLEDENVEDIQDHVRDKMERTKAVDRLVKICVQAKRSDVVILSAVGLGASSEETDFVAEFFLKENNFSGLMKLITSEECSENFLVKLAEYACINNWIDAQDKLEGLIYSCNEFLLDSIRNFLIKGGYFLAIKKWTKATKKLLTKTEIDEMLMFFCNRADICSAIDAAKELGDRGLMIKEIKVLAEAIKKKIATEANAKTKN